MNFGVGLSGSIVKTFTNYLTIASNNAANIRVRRRGIDASFC
jgi:hypothetical protein